MSGIIYFPNLNREIDVQKKLHSSVSSGKKQVHHSSQVSLVAKNDQVLKNLRTAKGCNIQIPYHFFKRKMQH